MEGTMKKWNNPALLQRLKICGVNEFSAKSLRLNWKPVLSDLNI